MNDTAEKAKIAAILRDEVMAPAEQGLASHKKLMPRLEGLRNKLKAASAAGNIDQIDFQLNEVDEQSDEIEACLVSLDQARDGIRGLLKDHPDLKGKSPAVEKVLAKVTAARDSLNDLQIGLKKLETEANKSRNATANSVKNRMREATAAWNEIENLVKKTYRDNMALVKELPGVLTQAKKAVEEHAAAALERLQTQARSTYAAKEYGDFCRQRLAEHETKFPRHLMPSELTDQFDKEKGQFTGMIAGIESTGLAISMLKDAIKELKIKPVDGGRVATELGFPDAAAADLKKLFDGSDVEVAKGFDALAKKHKVAGAPKPRDAIDKLARKSLR